MSDALTRRLSKPVASELIDWEDKAEAGDEVAKLAITNDLGAMAEMRMRLKRELEDRY